MRKKSVNFDLYKTQDTLFNLITPKVVARFQALQEKSGTGWVEHGVAREAMAAALKLKRHETFILLSHLCNIGVMQHSNRRGWRIASDEQGDAGHG